MSEKNVELVKRYIRAWNGRDFEADLVDPDFEHRGRVEWPGAPRVTRGREESRRRQALQDAQLRTLSG